MAVSLSSKLIQIIRFFHGSMIGEVPPPESSQALSTCPMEENSADNLQVRRLADLVEKVLGGIKTLCSQHQPWENRGAIQTVTPFQSPAATHHYRWRGAKDCGKLHILVKRHLQRRFSRQRDRGQDQQSKQVASTTEFSNTTAVLWKQKSSYTVYNAVKLSSLLFRCETWTVFRRHSWRSSLA
ncbi:hypothetical protein ElyMa_002589300 [Elysia marginata]|uniref:Uncharacterized protein n=1 Tax=Elysia marginata TaxID=1093978 RepID=A0AAV4H0C3_9GAST|nr:hypothetical protein ElyMa_002589300 [Elysia marginata]